MAILAHLAVVVGMVLIGYRHFDNVHTGVAAACMYLILPYTAQFAPCIYHAAPAALLVWAVEAYRRPVVAGLLLGVAGGVYLLSPVPLAAVVQLLLASRPGSLPPRLRPGAAPADRLAGVDLRHTRPRSLVHLQQMFHCGGRPVELRFLEIP